MSDDELIDSKELLTHSLVIVARYLLILRDQVCRRFSRTSSNKSKFFPNFSLLLFRSKYFTLNEIMPTSAGAMTSVSYFSMKGLLQWLFYGSCDKTTVFPVVPRAKIPQPLSSWSSMLSILTCSRPRRGHLTIGG